MLPNKRDHENFANLPRKAVVKRYFSPSSLRSSTLLSPRTPYVNLYPSTFPWLCLGACHVTETIGGSSCVTASCRPRGAIGTEMVTKGNTLALVILGMLEISTCSSDSTKFRQ